VLLQPIEAYIRTEAPPPGDALMVRGGPITSEKLREAAVRQSRAYSLQGAPMTSISVHGVVAGGSLEGVLAGHLRTYKTYAATFASRLELGGFTLLPTFEVPHFDIVLPNATSHTLHTLLVILGPPLVNPYKGPR